MTIRDIGPMIGADAGLNIRVREGEVAGHGIMESIITGEWPELGLTAESDQGVAHA